MTSKDLPCDSVFYDPQDLNQNMPEPETKEYSCTAEAREPKVLARVQWRSALTVEEAAEILGLSRAFAYEVVNRGEIPSIRIGGVAFLFPRWHCSGYWSWRVRHGKQQSKFRKSTGFGFPHVDEANLAGRGSSWRER